MFSCKRTSILWSLALIVVHASDLRAGTPYLTGIVVDGDSQTISMPNLPMSFTRQVEWMAPEGSRVQVGEVVVRVAPGSLVEEEESRRVALEEQRMVALSRDAESELAIIDAETAVIQAKSARDLAKLDAEIPATAVTQLDHDKAQLALENAENALRLAEATLINAKSKREELKPVTDLGVKNAESMWTRARDALERIEIRAERSGIMIYGENPMTGLKIFSGETLPAGVELATIANRDQLQFEFWVHDADIQHLSIGQSLTVIADALPDQEVMAEVAWIANYATTRETWSQGGYFKLIAEPNDTLPEMFLPGMAVFGEVN